MDNVRHKDLKLKCFGVISQKTLQFQVFVSNVIHKDLKLFWGDLTKATVAIVC